jgi:hypothetical protein
MKKIVPEIEEFDPDPSDVGLGLQRTPDDR